MSWNPLIHDCDGCGRHRGHACDGRYCGERLLAADRHRASFSVVDRGTRTTGVKVGPVKHPLVKYS